MRIGRTLPPAATPIDIRAILSGVWGIFRGRKELDRFQSELKEHFGVRHCFLVSSGKAAFTLILLALKELSPDRDEVLLPAFTCYSVPSSVIRAGLRIRLCDQRPDSFDFDFEQLSAMLHEGPPKAQSRAPRVDTESPVDTRTSTRSRDPIDKILAVVPTHLFGYAADVGYLRELIHDPQVALVEDAAQAMGQTVEGKKVGTLGDVSFFSVARGKAFSVVEGGVILTDRTDLARVLNRLVDNLPCYGLYARVKLFFMATALMLLMHPRLYWIPCSMPFLKLGETLFETDFPILQMSSFQAGLTRNWQRKLEKLQEIRKCNVNGWIDILKPARNPRSILPGSQSLALLRLPLKVADERKRGALLRDSARAGLGIMPAYPTSIDAIPELKGTVDDGKFPVAEGHAKELVTLPTHGYVTQEDMTAIARLLFRTTL
jgi:perosamine synthetase